MLRFSILDHVLYCPEDFQTPNKPRKFIYYNLIPRPLRRIPRVFCYLRVSG